MSLFLWQQSLPFANRGPAFLKFSWRTGQQMREVLLSALPSCWMVSQTLSSVIPDRHLPEKVACESRHSASTRRIPVWNAQLFPGFEPCPVVWGETKSIVWIIIIPCLLNNKSKHGYLFVLWMNIVHDMDIYANIYFYNSFNKSLTCVCCKQSNRFEVSDTVCITGGTNIMKIEVKRYFIIFLSGNLCFICQVHQVPYCKLCL